MPSTRRQGSKGSKRKPTEDPVEDDDNEQQQQVSHSRTFAEAEDDRCKFNVVAWCTVMEFFVVGCFWCVCVFVLYVFAKIIFCS